MILIILLVSNLTIPCYLCNSEVHRFFECSFRERSRKSKRNSKYKSDVFSKSCYKMSLDSGVHECWNRILVALKIEALTIQIQLTAATTGTNRDHIMTGA